MEKKILNALTNFFKKESTPSVILIIFTIAALILQNSPLSHLYSSFLHTPVEIRFADLHIAKPLLLWVNDGLMAVFFFLVGLELKREALQGHLSSAKEIILPSVAALGGMTVPALIYVALNAKEPFAMNGWAIPTATDIAFALGVLSLLGSRIPVSLKIFLTALAIIDDLGAIIIIALFYTTKLSVVSITVASIAIVSLFIINRFGVSKKAPYILIGIVLWVSVLKSGVHATLAGVILAFFIPLKTKKNSKEYSMLKEMEKDLHNWVAFFILPLFAFVNAGVDLKGISPQELLNSVPLGIILGLFVGKQLGVFLFSYATIKLSLAKLPKDSSWMQFYGVSVLTGIGFTMSLFIDSLAFNDAQTYHYADKLAILIGSFLSAVFGYLILKFSK